MAGHLDITVQAWGRWLSERPRTRKPSGGAVRPNAMPDATRKRIRDCYTRRFGQWGPRTLAHWARREGLGTWSPTTIAKVIDDLREKVAPKPDPVRYEVTRTGAMWSEDGAGFRERGHKKELVVAQDEHSRYKVHYRLVDGPADEEAVYGYLKEAFERYGPPLVLKHDGGKVFCGDRVRGLLDQYKVVDLTGPGYYPQYNGKKERSVRDIKSTERAMRRHRAAPTLVERLDASIRDLNDERPRPVLGGNTAREVYVRDRNGLPDRDHFIQEVNRTEEKLRDQAVTRQQRDGARRHAVELVLLHYGLLEIHGGRVNQFPDAF